MPNINLKPGEPITADAWNMLAQNANRSASMKGGNGVGVKNMGNGFNISSNPTAQWFWGIIAIAGPMGEDDYTDARYWVQRAYVSTDETDDDTATVAFDYDSAPYDDWITATNINEAIVSGDGGGHELPEGRKVRVYWEYDSGNPPTIRYILAAAPCSLFPVSLVKDGGADGGWFEDDGESPGFRSPSYTYTVTSWITGKQIATAASPQWAGFPGSCSPAGFGTGYYKDGQFNLFETDEMPNPSPCDNYDGEEPVGS